MFPILWPLAAILYFMNRKDPYVRWITFFLVIGGGGSYFALMHSLILPFLSHKGILTALELDILSVSVVMFMSMFYFLIPYVFLMSSLALIQKDNLKLALILLLPPAVLFFIAVEAIPQGINLNRLHIWAGLYILSGCIIYVSALMKAEPAIKRNYLRLNIIFIPILVVIYLKDFLFIDRIILADAHIIFQQKVDWEINSFYIDLWLLSLFFFYSIRHGILGIKLRLERHRLDVSMSSLSFGTTIINHTIKNEVYKIDYMVERAKEHISQNEKMKTIESLDKISSISDHLLSMAAKIKEKGEDIVLTEQVVEITQQIETELATLKPILDKRNIMLVRNYQYTGRLVCDPQQFREVFSNLCLNGIEAIRNETGELTVSVRQVRNQLIIAIQDTGCGIDKNHFAKIFEPFFTTKNLSTNYGLGLTYCYKVMKKHQGNIKIVESAKDKGTTIAMIFPKRRIVGVNNKLKGGSFSETDQRLTSGG